MQSSTRVGKTPSSVKCLVRPFGLRRLGLYSPQRTIIITRSCSCHAYHLYRDWAAPSLKYCDSSFSGCFDIGSREYFGPLITVLTPHNTLELMLVIRGNSFPSEQHRASFEIKENANPQVKT